VWGFSRLLIGSNRENYNYNRQYNKGQPLSHESSQNRSVNRNKDLWSGEQLPRFDELFTA